MATPLLILCLSFTAFLLLGVPVAFSIGLSALATLLYEGLPLAVGFQQMTSGMGIFSFLAIPFFIFAGELMLYGGIATASSTSHATSWAMCAAAWACRTWWPARCSAASRARPWRTSRPWAP